MTAWQLSGIIMPLVGDDDFEQCQSSARKRGMREPAVSRDVRRDPNAYLSTGRRGRMLLFRQSLHWAEPISALRVRPIHAAPASW